MNYYNEIKKQIINNEITKKVKDYSKNKSDLQTYYNIGKILAEAGKHYGEGIIKEYSKKLTLELGKKYKPSLLYKIKQFYDIYEKVPTMSGNLTWSHWYEMLSIKEIDKIVYYVNQCEINNLNVRDLRSKIKSQEYERLPKDTRNKIIKKDKFKVEDFVKNPILIKNSYNYNEISEKLLKQLILEDIDNFLLELGNNFSYIGNEYKIKVGNSYNYIDLLLYNIEFNCYVVVELKITELKKEYIGQIQIYMNYIDNNLRKIHQDKTIGIIICKKDNKFIMEYCSDSRILSREYELL
mgnify:FL=1